MKARRGAESFPDAAVIGADTVVALGLRILGKPADRDGARAMLRSLSGHRHRVITGLAFYRKAGDRLLTGYDLTYVTFRDADGRHDRGLPRSGQLPRQGGRLRRPGDRRRVRRPAQGLLRQRRRLPRGQGPPAARPLPRPRMLAVEIEGVDFPASAGTADGRRATRSSSPAPSPARPSGSRSSASAAPPGSPRSIRVETAVAAAGRTALPPLRGLRRLPLPALRLPDPARAQGAAPQADASTKAGCRGRGLGPQARQRRRPTSTATGTRWSSPSGRSTAPSPSASGRRPRGRKGRPTAGRCRSRSARSSPRSSGASSPSCSSSPRAHGLEGFEPATRKGQLRHLVLREGKRTGELMVLLVTTASPGDRSRPARRAPQGGRARR
ncbi:MAG: Maf family protein [Ignavibacteriales bacterium]|nr:Maf family protein [Ignavibacteriales bacterium]